MILQIVHFCYFQNTFPFVSTFRQTDFIKKKRRKKFVEQGIGIKLVEKLYRVSFCCESVGH